MLKFFDERTNKHIERVKENAKKISAKVKGLEKQVASHDASKFQEPEYTPYVWLTEFYRCKQENIPFKYPEGIEPQTKEATLHHIRNNPHHPEYWDANKANIDLSSNRDSANQPQVIDATKMNEVSMAEMVCDWAAMSQEKGTSLKEWADNNINKRWRFTDKQVQFIYDLVNIFAPQKKSGFQEWLLSETNLNDLYQSTINAFPTTTKRQYATQPIEIKNITFKPYVGMKTLYVTAEAHSETKTYSPIIIFKNVTYFQEERLNSVSITTEGQKYFFEKILQNQNDVLLRCDCKDFYWRFNYTDYTDQSLQGRKRAKYEAKNAPGSSNPLKLPGMCKHLIKLIETLHDMGLVD